MKRGKKKISIEFILAIIIAILLIASLLSLEFFEFFPSFTILVLLSIFILIKISHIFKNKGTSFEDYISLSILIIFTLLRLFTIGQKINTTIIVIGVFITLYSIGVIPSTKRISNSKNVISFILSYILFIVTIIFLFSGTYALNNNLFTESDNPTALTFKETIYFSTITFTTVGYGDFAPTGINMLIATIEAILGMALNIGFIGYILASKRFNK